MRRRCRYCGEKLQFDDPSKMLVKCGRPACFAARQAQWPAQREAICAALTRMAEVSGRPDPRWAEVDFVGGPGIPSIIRRYEKRT